LLVVFVSMSRSAFMSAPVKRGAPGARHVRRAPYGAAGRAGAMAAQAAAFPAGVRPERRRGDAPASG